MAVDFLNKCIRIYQYILKKIAVVFLDAEKDFDNLG